MTMRAIHRKLFRDLVAMRSQALAIALVLAAGIAMYVAYFSTFDSLQRTLANYYRDYRFADVFAGVKRAPLSLLPRILEIDGVTQADLRVVVDVTLDLPGVTEPMTGRLVSMDYPRARPLNDVFLRRGQEPEPTRPDEVLVSEAFADARGLGPGDRIGAVINGRRRDLRIVGVALSPEYVYSIRPGDLLPDPSRLGIFWMERRALGAAFDMEGGFNDVALRLSPGAAEPAVAAALDALLLAARELGWKVVAARRQAHQVERVLRLHRLADDVGHERDVFARGQTRDQVVELEHEADVVPPVLSQFRLGRLRQIVVQVVHVPGGRRVEAADDIEKGGFPAARRSKQNDELAGPDVEADAAKGVYVHLAHAVDLSNVLQAENNGRGAGHWLDYVTAGIPNCLIASSPHCPINRWYTRLSPQAGVAQLVEQLIRNQQVIRSSRIAGSIY